jgi:hypothetical protein
MNFIQKFIKFITPPPIEAEKVTKTKVTSTSGPMTNAIIKKTPVVKAKRVRTKKGKFVADNKSTPDVNEAWVGGKAPVKKSKKKK